MITRTIPYLFLFFVGLIACSNKKSTENYMEQNKPTKHENADTITLGAGCFWCVEAVFQQVKGVYTVTSGYSGGFVKNPAYREVCNGTTGHAEVCQLTYNPAEISVEELLEIFFKTHDPTTLNRQGNDVGTQYRSAIFYHNENQKNIAEKTIKALDESGAFSNKIITEVTAFKNFYPAEDYHNNYYNLNSGEPYCRYIIAPKLDKFNAVFKHLKKSR